MGRQLSTYVGGTSQYPYILTNGGNGPDSFTLSFTQSGVDDFNPGLKVYRNLDGDGNFTDEITAPISLAADASVNLMVRATVTSGPQVGDTGVFALVATSTGDTSVTDTNNYAQLTVSADGLLGVTNTVSPGGSAVPGATLTYTVTGTVASGNPVGAVSNVVTVDGAPRSGVLITDTLSNLNFTALSSVSATNGGSGVNAVAILVEGSGSFLLAGNTAQVPATALAGSTVGGSAAARFDGNGDAATNELPETTTPVAVAVPFSAAGSTNVALTVTATPAGGSADTTASTVTAVTAAGLTQLGSGDGSDATAPTSTNVTVGGNPGGNALFRLELLNGRPVDEAFILSGPAGTVFYLDLDGDGVIDPGEPTVTTTAALTPGQSANLIAAVPVAAGSATGTSAAVFTATSTLDATRTSSVTDTLRVAGRSVTVTGSGGSRSATTPADGSFTLFVPGGWAGVTLDFTGAETVTGVWVDGAATLATDALGSGVRPATLPVPAGAARVVALGVTGRPARCGTCTP